MRINGTGSTIISEKLEQVMFENPSQNITILSAITDFILVFYRHFLIHSSF